MRPASLAAHQLATRATAPMISALSAKLTTAWMFRIGLMNRGAAARCIGSSGCATNGQQIQTAAHVVVGTTQLDVSTSVLTESFGQTANGDIVWITRQTFHSAIYQDSMRFSPRRCAAHLEVVSVEKAFFKRRNGAIVAPLVNTTTKRVNKNARSASQANMLLTTAERNV